MTGAADLADTNLRNIKCTSKYMYMYYNFRGIVCNKNNDFNQAAYMCRFSSITVMTVGTLIILRHSII